MVDFLSLLPLDIGTIIINLVNALLACIAIIAVDKVIAHEIEPKHALAMSIVAFFVMPIIGSAISMMIALPPFIAGTFFTIILPLLVWIGLGEIMLQADQMTKLKVLVVAFVVYYVLSIFVAPHVHGMLANILPVF